MPNDSQKTKVNFQDIFKEETALLLRKYLIENISFKDNSLPCEKSHYIVINPTDFCPVACPNCLYSSTRGPKLNFKSLSESDIDKIIQIMNEAKVKMVVFSGGGEPIENFPAILKILKKVKTLQDSIIITSAYFAKTNNSTQKIFSQLTNAAWRARKKNKLPPIKLTIRISYDADHCKKISVENIINVIQYIKKQNNPLLRGLVRTILARSEQSDEKIAKALGLEILPPKIKGSLIKNLPVIDGLPCRWLKDKKSNFQIPVIYKPMYFVGRTQSRTKTQIWSYKRIIDSEVKSGTKFNLCLRGPKGGGHNYYETIFKGFEFWQSTKQITYNTPKSNKDKEIALYLTANGRLVVNSGVPDLFIEIKDLKNWSAFLKYVYSDPIQRTLLKKGPFYIQKIAQEVAKNLPQRIKEANFVFSITLFSLESAALRLYVTLRLVQKLYKQKRISIKGKRLLGLANLPARKYKKMFLAQNPLKHKDNIKDPIIGDEKGLFYINTKDA